MGSLHRPLIQGLQAAQPGECDTTEDQNPGGQRKAQGQVTHRMVDIGGGCEEHGVDGVGEHGTQKRPPGERLEALAGPEELFRAQGKS